ncbi:MAG: hypothetical protein WAM18_13125, partial [Halobacillus sp.]
RAGLLKTQFRDIFMRRKVLRGMIRFPRACAEPPQSSTSGVSPIMFIPQESSSSPSGPGQIRSSKPL